METCICPLLDVPLQGLMLGCHRARSCTVDTTFCSPTLICLLAQTLLLRRIYENSDDQRCLYAYTRLASWRP